MLKKFIALFLIISFVTFCFFANEMDLNQVIKQSNVFFRKENYSARVEVNVFKNDIIFNQIKFNFFNIRSPKQIEFLISFMPPGNYKGLKLLCFLPQNYEKPNVWLKVQSVDYSFRIPCPSNEIPFFGMDFSVGDLIFLEMEQVFINQIFSENNLLCLEAVPIQKDYCDKIVYYIDLEKDYIMVSEIYKNNKLIKKLEVNDLTFINGVWFPKKITMFSEIHNSYTVANFSDYFFVSEIEEYVSQEYLQKSVVKATKESHKY